jgi:hypothetical protein
VDFPFQISTELTYAVLAVRAKEEQLKLVKAEIAKIYGRKHLATEIIKQVEALFADPDLRLTMI